MLNKLKRLIDSENDHINMTTPDLIQHLIDRPAHNAELCLIFNKLRSLPTCAMCSSKKLPDELFSVTCGKPVNICKGHLTDNHWQVTKKPDSIIINLPLVLQETRGHSCSCVTKSGEHWEIKLSVGGVFKESEKIRDFEYTDRCDYHS